MVGLRAMPARNGPTGQPDAGARVQYQQAKRYNRPCSAFRIAPQTPRLARKPRMTAAAAAPIRIDFVSDVVCPWCAIGLAALEKAITEVGDRVQVDLHVQPFELNPGMAPEGEDILEHLAHKYGRTPDELRQTQEMIRQRGAEVGFVFRPEGRGRIYNTFDAHRLLDWADAEGQSGQQLALKRALLQAYFTEGKNPSDHAVLIQAAASVGLDAARAAAVLAADDGAQHVRTVQAFYRSAGIQSVPSIIFNQKHLVSGGQPVAVFADVLRRLADQPDT